MWCIGTITTEYRKRMYALLALYAKPYDPKRPLLCVDEKSKQLLADARHPLLATPGHVRKEDYETFGPERARDILSRISFHYTPKHASWLNMAEIEIGILDRQCLGKRMEDEAMLKRETRAWQKRRNRTKTKIEWTFTRQDADEKLGKHYVA